MCLPRPRQSPLNSGLEGPSNKRMRIAAAYGGAVAFRGIAGPLVLSSGCRATWNEAGLYLCWEGLCFSLTLESVAGALFAVFMCLFAVVAFIVAEDQLSITWERMSVVVVFFVIFQLHTHTNNQPESSETIAISRTTRLGSPRRKMARNGTPRKVTLSAADSNNQYDPRPPLPLPITTTTTTKPTTLGQTTHTTKAHDHDKRRFLEHQLGRLVWGCAHGDRCTFAHSWAELHPEASANEHQLASYFPD